MKIVCIADTHSRHRDVEIPDGDVLIHAGDISLHGEIETFMDFNEWLGELPHSFKIFTVGNHDRIRSTLVQKIVSNGIFLNDTALSFGGIKFYGSPQTPSVWDEKEEYCYIRHDWEEATRIWDKIPIDTDVLITHGPARGILDYVDKKHAEVGCTILLEKVLEVRPKIHIFGHIHESAGVINQRHGIKFINCSIMDKEFSLTNKAWVTEV